MSCIALQKLPLCSASYLALSTAILYAFAMRLLQYVNKLVIASLSLLDLVLAESCYCPDGTIVDDTSYTICNGSLGGGSACCDFGDLCTDVGLCIGYVSGGHKPSLRSQCSRRHRQLCAVPDILSVIQKAG